MTPEIIKQKLIFMAYLSALKIDMQLPTVVCLCGSTRFHKEYVQANYDLTMQGKIVLSVGFFGHAVDAAHGQTVGITSAQKGELDDLHKRKIDLADEVFVINQEGYIGDSTRSEIEYTRLLGKPITYLHPQLLSDIDRETDADPSILENIRKEASAKICMVCMDIGRHTTKEHQVLTDRVPAQSAARAYEDLQKEVGTLADAIADQPEGLFNDEAWVNISIISRISTCIHRLKEKAGTFWKDAEGCKTVQERLEKISAANEVALPTGTPFWCQDCEAVTDHTTENHPKI